MMKTVSSILTLLTVVVSLNTLPGSSRATAARSLVPGFHGQPPTSAFDSGLWQQFYSQDSIDQQEQRLAKRSPSVPRPSTRRSGRLTRSRQALAGTDSLALVIVDEQQLATDGEVETSGVVLSDWQMVTLRAPGRNAGASAAGQGGPGATTLLVGLVATIVVCGAMFSGRRQ